MKYIINLLKQTFRATLNIHLRSTNQIHKDLKKITDILDNYQTSSGRGRDNSSQHFSIYISKHFSHLNVIKYILKHLQHAFQLLIYYTSLRYRWNSSRIYIKSQTFQDHQTSRGTQCNWHLSIYISKHFSHLNAMKYIINLLKQTFRATLNIH